MGSNFTDVIHKGNSTEGSETTIEIKIKTLDSQTYTLRVNKQMPVPELKEHIACVTGVLSEQQRLICRGRVLKDDQLLSAYHVEDGHTLHLVTRQPIPPSSGILPVIDPPSSSPGRRIQVAPGIVVETFDVTSQGDGVHPDINRIVSSVLGAFGISDTGGAIAGVDVQAGDSGVHERTPGASGITASASPQNEQPGMTSHSDRSNSGLGVPTAISLGALHPHVIPDSLTTLSQYLSHMRQEYGTNGESNAQGATMQDTHRQSTAALPVLPVQESLPTPDVLADILLFTREMLVDHTAECLLQLGRQLHEQSDVTDPTRRLSVQSNAWRSGVLFQNLGAFLLELGRTTMMLRMGQAASEAIVNAGPAVFISQAGPNPLMVQPLPFQPGASFGVIPRQTGSGMLNDTSAGLFPRRIDIQIRRGSSGVERGSLPPIRAMVAAVPGPISRLPGLGRFQHVASGHLTDRRGLQAYTEHHPPALQELQPASDSGVQQNTGEHLRDGNLTNAAVEQGGQLSAPNSRRFRFSVLSTTETENNHASEREVPSEVYQILGALFPGSDIQVEETGPRTTTTASAIDNAGAISTAMNAQETESGANDEGIFLSNLLRQIMPRISQQSDGAPDDTSMEASHASEHRTAHESSTEAGNSDVGTSHQQSDIQSGQPNSKRQKME